MQQISPFLWFDGEAEDAMNHYVSIFRNSRIVQVARYGEEGPGTPGTAMVVTAELNGQKFIALNGGPANKINLGVSFLIECDSQEEVDHFWNGLVEGGTPIQCGWLQDKFGVPWQVVPRRFMEMMSDPDPEKTGRVMKAMFGMVKFDIPELERAYRGD